MEDVAMETDEKKEEEIRLKDLWSIIEDYFEKKGILYSQKKDYQLFLHGIQNQINELGPIKMNCPPHNVNSELTHEFTLSTVHFGKPCRNETDVKQKMYTESANTTDINGENSITFLTPDMCRKRNLSYTFSLYVDINKRINYINKTFKDTFLPKVYLGEIPAMVGSEVDNRIQELRYNQGNNRGECPYDQGGYFISKGAEKILIAQERKLNNQVFINKKFQNNNGRKKKSKCSLIADLKSSSECTFKSPSMITLQFVKTKKSTNEVLRATIPFLKKEKMIPIVIFFRILGIQDMTIMRKFMINDEDEKELYLLEASFEEAMTITTYRDSIRYVYAMTDASNVRNKANVNVSETEEFTLIEKTVCDLIDKDVFPHVGIGSKYRLEKAFMLSFMMKRLISVKLGRSDEDDRDVYKNKRIDTTGRMMAELLSQILRRCMKTFKVEYEKNLNDGGHVGIELIKHNNIMTLRFAYCMSSGTWGISQSTNKIGINAPYSRICYLSGISHATRIDTSMRREHKVGKPRKLSSTLLGRVCPAETPEGKNVGLVKNTSLMSHISWGTSTSVLMDSFYELGLKPLTIDTLEKQDYIKVLINGAWKGILESMEEKDIFVEGVKKLRRTCSISYELSIYYDRDQEIVKINTDAGRLMRPLLIVRDGRLVLTRERLQTLTHHKRMKDSYMILMAEGCMEFIDSEEEYSCFVAIDPVSINESHTHCEIHPSSIFGYVASSIVFTEHNPSTRASFQCAMGKQAIGLPFSNINDRMDSATHVLYYPEKPLVTTRPSKILNLDRFPTGQNAYVLVANYNGYNQEDAIIINQSSLDRGLFRSTFYKTYKDVERRMDKTYSETFEIPDPNTCKGMKAANYGKLEEDGIVSVGTKIDQDDIIIGKTFVSSEKTKSNNQNSAKQISVETKDHSMTMRNMEVGTVDKVVVSTDAAGWKLTKVRIRSVNNPQVGDKFCLTVDHDVLTDSGWKQFPDLLYSDKIACLRDGELVYDYPTDIYTFDHNGPMYKIVNKGIDLKTTMNHRMWCRKESDKEFGLHPAHELKGERVFYQRTALNSKEDILAPEELLLTCKSNLSDLKKTDHILKLLALLCCRGSNHAFNLNGIQYIAVKNSFRIRRLAKKFISKLGIEGELVEGEFDSSYFIFTNHEWYTYVFQNRYERFPTWIWELSQRQSRLFLYHLMQFQDLRHGMGNDRDVRFFSFNAKLSDDLQRLALHSGLSAEISVENHGMSILKLNLSQKNPKSFKKNHSWSEHIIAQEDIVPFIGKVYCVQVPSHVFYVRRNGVPLWTGNSSRHGQKGTCGITLRSEDMPFDAYGNVPDIIINPQSQPSRMTVGQLLETITGKVAILTGEPYEKNAFETCDIDEIGDLLHKYGYQRKGNVNFTNGIDGTPIQSSLFFGPCYYQRLKHLVDDKIHARATGPVNVLTRQPSEGKARDGGKRFGEMERDCLIAWGVALLLKNNLCDYSDKTNIKLCYHCGSIAYIKKSRNEKGQINDDYEMRCTFCQNQDSNMTPTVHNIEIPYATKLLIQELQSMAIGTFLKFDEESKTAKFKIKDIDLDEILEEAKFQFDSKQK